MEAPASPPLLYRIFSWLIGEPIIRQTNLQVLKIPADGSLPHLVRLNTIDVASEGNIDQFVRYIPDCRSYLGTQEVCCWRDIARMEVRDQSPPELNGVYYGWKSFALDHVPLSEYTGFCGDAFIAKTPFLGTDEHGAVYEDVPDSFITSPLLRTCYVLLVQSPG